MSWLSDDDGEGEGDSDAELGGMMAMGWNVDGEEEVDSEEEDEFDEELNDWADWMEAEADALSQSSEEPGASSSWLLVGDVGG